MPLPPLAIPSGGKPAYVIMGPGPKLGPKKASVAAKFGGQFAITLMKMKTDSMFIQTAKLESHPKL